MTIYYVNNEVVRPKFNYSLKSIRDAVEYKKYWKTAQAFDQAVTLIVGMIRSGNDLANPITGEFMPNYLAEELLDIGQFEQINENCDIEFIDWLIFVIADELGVI